MGVYPRFISSLSRWRVVCLWTLHLFPLLYLECWQKCIASLVLMFAHFHHRNSCTWISFTLCMDPAKGMIWTGLGPRETYLHEARGHMPVVWDAKCSSSCGVCSMIAGNLIGVVTLLHSMGVHNMFASLQGQQLQIRLLALEVILANFVINHQAFWKILILLNLYLTSYIILSPCNFLPWWHFRFLTICYKS